MDNSLSEITFNAGFTILIQNCPFIKLKLYSIVYQSHYLSEDWIYLVLVS